MAFGLVSTETLSSSRSRINRRKIFYQFPTGAAPLMGLLSMLPEEGSDKDEFGWWERRFPVLRTNTVASGTAPFTTGAGAALTDSGSGVTLTADTEYRVAVVSSAQFKPTHVIELREITSSDGASTHTVIGTVTEVVSATSIKFRPYSTFTAVDNTTTDNNGKVAAIIGTANPQGGRSGTGIIQFPVNPTNFTQIFRTAFNVTRTALKGGLEWDKDGPYASLAKENGLRHMVEMEKAFLFGQKHEVLVTDAETGDATPEKKTGGVRWFLEQWEAANSVYRGGSGAAAITSISDPLKRIIPLSGTLTKAAYRTYISNLFRYTNDRAYEKLCLCGGTFLETINNLFEDDISVQVGIANKERNWEFMVHSHTTLRGTVHYKVHPLMDEDPDLQDAAFFLDMGNLKYRPLNDSDTVFLKNRQDRDRDGRKDEWITECGLELRFPESCMLITGATAAA